MFDLQEFFNRRLPELVRGYTYREEQVEFARSIAEVIEAGEHGVFEAGTGIGKTLGYLIPALASGRTVIVSTGTRNLQDQVYLKDIPMLSPLFPDVRVSLLKGRANYLCLHRLKLNLKVHDRNDRLDQIMEVRAWSARTRTGDLTELFDPEEHPRLMHQVTSTRDNCLGSKCPEFLECPLYRAREVASASDLVIVNHHLLFADLAQKEDALQTILPEAGVIIVDEAHRVPDVARQFFGQQISSGQIGELIRDTRAELSLLGNDDPACLAAVSLLESCLERLTALVMASDEQDFNRWYEEKPRRAVADVDLALSELSARLELTQERSEGLVQMFRRTVRFSDQFAMLTEETAPDVDYVHWIDRRERGFIVYLSPVSVADDMRRVTASPDVSWIFTSATLCVEGSFHHAVKELGLTDVITRAFRSPFNYREVVRAWLPDVPPPGDTDHTRELVRQVLPLIEVNQGRTFFLFTSYRALHESAELMRDLPNPVFVQGSMSRTRLVNAFAEAPGAVLLATQSFWEGVDVRGAELRCLIVDKLPFPSPADPLFQAQAAAVEERGGNSFSELSLPKTVLALKQGFGRLIREESDCGLFVLGDSRLSRRSYRGYVMDNLPDMEWLEDAGDAIDWLRAL